MAARRAAAMWRPWRLSWLLVELRSHHGERGGDVGAWSAEMAARRAAPVSEVATSEAMAAELAAHRAPLPPPRAELSPPEPTRQAFAPTLLSSAPAAVACGMREQVSAATASCSSSPGGGSVEDGGSSTPLSALTGSVAVARVVRGQVGGRGRAPWPPARPAWEAAAGRWRVVDALVGGDRERRGGVRRARAGRRGRGRAPRPPTRPAWEAAGTQLAPAPLPASTNQSFPAGRIPASLSIGRLSPPAAATVFGGLDLPPLVLGSSSDRRRVLLAQIEKMASSSGERK